MINHHPHGRFQLHEKPINLPGLDIINKSPDGPVFDLSVDTDNLPWGTAYIRAEHVMDMAKSLGMKSLEDWNALVKENIALREQVEALPNAVRKLSNGLDSLLSDFNSGLSEPTNVPLPAVAEESEEPALNDAGSEQTDGQSNSPVIDKGPDKLSGTSSDEPFGFLNFPHST